MVSPLTIMSWPQAILHVDGDSFFASVEQALTPAYRGRPLVTGQERGIAIAISLEAKKLGIKRGMTMAEIRRQHPECLIVPGHYEAYMAFAHRMFSIMRRYTPEVEEYSIDEAFADITGMRRTLNLSYEGIAKAMQAEVEAALGITVSVGVSLSKTLAKLASTFRKPHGITVVKGRYIHILLQHNAIHKVWGIGPSTTAFLQKYGCKTAYDFVMKPPGFITEYLTKREMEIYRELRGEAVYPVSTTTKETYQSMSKAKTFAPTKDRNNIFAQLMKNMEEATAKCRKYHLVPKTVVIALKTQSFRTAAAEAKLSRLSASSVELAAIIETLFNRCFVVGEEYRQTMCTLTGLVEDSKIQLTLFDQRLSIDQLDILSEHFDDLNKRFGRGTLFLADSLLARRKSVLEFRMPKLDMVV